MDRSFPGRGISVGGLGRPEVRKSPTEAVLREGRAGLQGPKRPPSPAFGWTRRPLEATLELGQSCLWRCRDGRAGDRHAQRGRKRKPCSPPGPAGRGQASWKLVRKDFQKQPTWGQVVQGDREGPVFPWPSPPGQDPLEGWPPLAPTHLDTEPSWRVCKPSTSCSVTSVTTLGHSRGR